MVLMKGSQIPKDAVVLDEVEAISYVWDVVSKWDSWSDIWALRYGPMVLGAINSVSGVIINNHYRWKLKLGNYGYFSSTLPLTVMPGILTLIFHKHLISTDLLLMKNDTCPVCYEVKSSAIQISMGLLYPMVLAPTSALMLANRYATYRVPHLFEGPKVMFGFLKKHTKPFTGTLGYIALIQLAASAIITYFEMKNTFTLRHKIVEIENKMEQELNDNKIRL
nr:uncharacterized protein LOC113395143 [Vanessa tameamea]